MAEATIAPWEVVKESSRDKWAIFGPSNRDVIGFVVDVLPSETAVANARLISAAPDLLAACRDMLAKIERMYPDDWTGTKALARAAIAKAEGK